MHNPMNSKNHYDVIVIGAGPAGLTAGIYLSRARLKTLIVNEGTVGGQLVLTHEIANYPGVESISGYQLANIMKKQALSFGCEIKSNVSIGGIETGRRIEKCNTIRWECLYLRKHDNYPRRKITHTGCSR